MFTKDSRALEIFQWLFLTASFISLEKLSFRLGHVRERLSNGDWGVKNDVVTTSMACVGTSGYGVFILFVTRNGLIVLLSKL